MTACSLGTQTTSVVRLCAQEPEGKVPLEPHVLRGSIGILNEVGYGATGIPRVNLDVIEVRKRGRQEDVDLRIELAFV